MSTYKIDIKTNGEPRRRDLKLKLTKPMTVGGKLFLEGFLAQASDESTLGVAVAGGIWNGLKYKGSVARGVKAGALIEVGMCTLNGLRNVLKNYRAKAREFDYDHGCIGYVTFTEEDDKK